jgi:uncharacterized protein
MSLFRKFLFISFLFAALFKGSFANANEYLLFATEKNYLQHAKKALNQGASATIKDYFGRTPLMYACINGNIDMVRLLLLSGASANSHLRDREGKTAYMYAREKGNQKLVEVLEYYGIKE